MDLFTQIQSSIKSNYSNLTIITITASVIVGTITVILVAKDVIAHLSSGGKS